MICSSYLTPSAMTLALRRRWRRLPRLGIALAIGRPMSRPFSIDRGNSGSCRHALCCGRAIRIALLALTVGCLGGCSLSVGAGASGSLGRRSGHGGFDCDGFESCDIIYRAAVARAQRCQAEQDDCEQEDSDVARSYRALREQTLRELDALRAAAGEAAEARTESEECRAGH
jgi:hypothetical protein